MSVNFRLFKHVVGVQKGYHVIKYLVSYVHAKITLYTLHELYDIFSIRTVYWKRTWMMVTIIQSTSRFGSAVHQLGEQFSDCFSSL